MLESHLKHCNIDGDGQSVQQEINSWNEAIGDGVEPAEQPDSQGAGNVAVMATATVEAVGPRLALSGDGRQETGGGPHGLLRRLATHADRCEGSLAWAVAVGPGVMCLKTHLALE